jgi:predicted Zn-ribbon and HTH transcriptional regulator
MGCKVDTKCKSCGHAFSYDDGGGFFFMLLPCGRTKSIGNDDMGKLQLRFQKGLALKSQADRRARGLPADEEAVEQFAHLEPLSAEDYFAAVEKKAGKCRCGGNLRFDAPPRCPRCRSTDLAEGKVSMLYD